MEVFYIGLTVIALLTLWNSKLLDPLHDRGAEIVANTGNASIIYFYECAYCKGFWMCVIGGIFLESLWLAFPAFGVVVIWLSLVDLLDSYSLPSGTSDT